MSLVCNPADLPAALADAADDEGAAVLIEEYVPGTPMVVGLLELPGGSVVVFSPLTTDATEADFYDADTKLDVNSRGTVTVRAADLAPAVLDELTEHARTLWDGLGLHGSARIDFILTEDYEPYVLEVTTTPGMSRDSNFVVGQVATGTSRLARYPAGKGHSDGSRQLRKNRRGGSRRRGHRPQPGEPVRRSKARGRHRPTQGPTTSPAH